MNDIGRKFRRHIAVTGGAGFIGSNLLLLLVPKYPDYQFVNIDCLTYAANLSNLAAIDKAPNYRFERVDISEFKNLERCFGEYGFDAVIHLAAESHVDRSIIGPAQFVKTNITGTFNLLELARTSAERTGNFRFHHVSTDEVFGSAEDNEKFTEDSPYHPNSPYAASKAAADHLVSSYHNTYGLDVVTTNCSNNYGPFQFPEKLIPLVINNAIRGNSIPVYGDGKHVRDWLFVEDHCEALDLAFHNGDSGRTYNICGGNETRNIDLVKKVCDMLGQLLNRKGCAELIEFVADRPGHDRRYAMDSSRIRKELKWKPRHNLDEGLRKTVEWYLQNKEWLNKCVSGDYKKYYETVYGNR